MIQDHDVPVAAKTASGIEDSSRPRGLDLRAWRGFQVQSGVHPACSKSEWAHQLAGQRPAEGLGGDVRACRCDTACPAGSFGQCHFGGERAAFLLLRPFGSRRDGCTGGGSGGGGRGRRGDPHGFACADAPRVGDAIAPGELLERRPAALRNAPQSLAGDDPMEPAVDRAGIIGGVGRLPRRISLRARVAL